MTDKQDIIFGVCILFLGIWMLASQDASSHIIFWDLIGVIDIIMGLFNIYIGVEYE